MKMRLIKVARARLRRPGGAKPFGFRGPAWRLIEYGCCKGVQGPSSGVELAPVCTPVRCPRCRNENFACEASALYLARSSCGLAASAPRAMPRRKNVTQPTRPRREWHFASLAWRAPLRRHSCSINIGSFLCGRWRPTRQIGKLIMVTVSFFTSRAIAARSPPAYRQYCSPSSEDGRAPCWARLWSSTGVAR